MKTNALMAVFVALCLLMACRFLKGDDLGKTGELYTKEFNALNREEQIRKCGECHKQEFENELAGPHYNAHKQLIDHAAFVNSDKYQCAFYTTRVNNAYQGECMRCHATANMFETVFKDYRNAAYLTDTLLSIQFPLPADRKETTSRVTGVDCITCHFDGRGVLSANEKFEKPSAAVCNPKFAKFFKTSDMTCYPCHFDEVRSLHLTAKTNHLENMNCVGCHQETGTGGKGTHYYYWSHDAPGKENKVLLSLFSNLSLNVKPGTSSAVINWKNTSLPHNIGLCPEVILNCEVLDKDSAVLGKTKIRINRKEEFDPSMYKTLGNNLLGGEKGVAIPAYNASVDFPIDLKKGADARMLRITATKKGQYWFPDSLGAIGAQKIIALPLHSSVNSAQQ